MNDFIEECAAFPNGAHDDQVDANDAGAPSLEHDSTPAYFVKYIIANIYARKFNLSIKNTPVGGQLGGSFARALTFWVFHRRSVPNAAVKKRLARAAVCQKRTATSHASQHVVGEGPPRLRHDCER